MNGRGSKTTPGLGDKNGHHAYQPLKQVLGPDPPSTSYKWDYN